MTTIATENYRFSNVVKDELWASKGYCRLAVTVNEASAEDYVIGQVLGKVTADGKYKIAVETAVDGSEDFAAIVLEDKAIAAATDTTVLVMVRGPAAVAKQALTLDATYDNDTKKDAIYDAMDAAGIMVLEQI